jgi:endonuclease III
VNNKIPDENTDNILTPAVTGEFMKDTKSFADKIQQLFRSLKRKYPKPDCPVYEEPVDALVYAFLSEQPTDQQAHITLKRIREHFIDLNDLRVSRPEEIVEVTGPDSAITLQTAAKLTTALKAIFEKYNMITLADIKKIGKKPIREILSRLPAVSPFVVDYCMLTAFSSHAIPLTERMLHYLKAEHIAMPDADPQQVSQMLTRQISAKEAYTFFALLRKEAEQPADKAKPKSEKTKKQQKKT